MEGIDKIFSKIDEINGNVADMQRDIAVMGAREQPGLPCRNYIENEIHKFKIEGFGSKDDFQKVNKELHKKVSYGVVIKTLGTLSVILGIILAIIRIKG